MMTVIAVSKKGDVFELLYGRTFPGIMFYQVLRVSKGCRMIVDCVKSVKCNRGNASITSLPGVPGKTGEK